MTEKYRPPVGPESNKPREQSQEEYVPPVGPGSKSVPPSGDWRELPEGLIPNVQEVEE